ncbi:MAG TPA: TIGR04282 family arsenosugar biosynthesis glycosyltransferase, partial [Candidatus Deferrimicrobium sp.]|nr:TIGR04282 family arsenosugar biosynthesis glycosyltransferase [Candidatus Deferrimicrobium sp.]
KVPKPGETKTRLMTQISGEECVMLHLACLRDICHTVKDLDVQGYVYFTETNEVDLPPQIIKRLQRGYDLGQRLYNAAVEVLAEYDKLIFLGADLPNLTADLLQKAIDYLDEFDTVIGPATDGGYYLLGIRNAHAKLFADIEWGGAKVLDQTIEQIAESKLSYILLESKNDIDTWEDLIDFYEGNKVRNTSALMLKTFGITKTLVEKYVGSDL